MIDNDCYKIHGGVQDGLMVLVLLNLAREKLRLRERN